MAFDTNKKTKTETEITVLMDAPSDIFLHVFLFADTKAMIHLSMTSKYFYGLFEQFRKTHFYKRSSKDNHKFLIDLFVKTKKGAINNENIADYGLTQYFCNSDNRFFMLPCAIALTILELLKAEEKDEKLRNRIFYLLNKHKLYKFSAMLLKFELANNDNDKQILLSLFERKFISNYVRRTHIKLHITHIPTLMKTVLGEDQCIDIWKKAYGVANVSISMIPMLAAITKDYSKITDFIYDFFKIGAPDHYHEDSYYYVANMIDTIYYIKPENLFDILYDILYGDEYGVLGDDEVQNARENINYQLTKRISSEQDNYKEKLLGEIIKNLSVIFLHYYEQTLPPFLDTAPTAPAVFPSTTKPNKMKVHLLFHENGLEFIVFLCRILFPYLRPNQITKLCDHLKQMGSSQNISPNDLEKIYNSIASLSYYSELHTIYKNIRKNFRTLTSPNKSLEQIKPAVNNIYGFLKDLADKKLPFPDDLMAMFTKACDLYPKYTSNLIYVLTLKNLINIEFFTAAAKKSAISTKLAVNTLKQLYDLLLRDTACAIKLAKILLPIAYPKASPVIISRIYDEKENPCLLRKDYEKIITDSHRIKSLCEITDEIENKNSDNSSPDTDKNIIINIIKLIRRLFCAEPSPENNRRAIEALRWIEKNKRQYLNLKNHKPNNWVEIFSFLFDALSSYKQLLRKKKFERLIQYFYDNIKFLNIDAGKNPVITKLFVRLNRLLGKCLKNIACKLEISSYVKIAESLLQLPPTQFNIGAISTVLPLLWRINSRLPSQNAASFFNAVNKKLINHESTFHIGQLSINIMFKLMMYHRDLDPTESTTDTAKPTI